MSPFIRRTTGVSRRRAALLFAGLAIAGCDHTASFTPDEETPVVPVGLAPAANAPTAAATFAGGIPFGMFAQPLSLYGDRYNGGHRNTTASDLLNSLTQIRNAGGKVVVVFAGSNNNYKDADGHFSMSLWQSRVDRYRGVNFSSFIEDGTVIAHYLLDEPNDPNNWNGQPVPPATVELMAEYSKSIWPTLPTVVRVDASYLTQGNPSYQYLDAAWAQYVERKGAPGDYLSRNVADAQSVGLQLIVGLNLLKGGPGNTALTASLIQSLWLGVTDQLLSLRLHQLAVRRELSGRGRHRRSYGCPPPLGPEPADQELRRGRRLAASASARPIRFRRRPPFPRRPPILRRRGRV